MYSHKGSDLGCKVSVWCVCVFTLQTGDFLTVDRCKVQGARYQDDSKADTTVGVGFFSVFIADLNHEISSSVKYLVITSFRRYHMMKNVLCQ